MPFISVAYGPLSAVAAYSPPRASKTRRWALLEPRLWLRTRIPTTAQNSPPVGSVCLLSVLRSERGLWNAHLGVLAVDVASEAAEDIPLLNHR